MPLPALAAALIIDDLAHSPARPALYRVGSGADDPLSDQAGSMPNRAIRARSCSVAGGRPDAQSRCSSSK